MQELKEAIVAVGRTLLSNGLVAATWGNISVRQADNILITPSGESYDKLTAADIVCVGSDGSHAADAVPSSELPLHLAIYQKRADVEAIIHTHSVFASAFAAARCAIPPIIEDLVQVTGGVVPVADYALPGTQLLAENVIEALGSANAVLLANHGAVGCGGSLREALTACELVEKTAQIALYAKQLGGAKQLMPEDISVMRDFYLQHYRQRQEENK